MCPKCLLDPGARPSDAKAGSLLSGLVGQGRRFGDYELGQQIGRGGMGVVYEAVQAGLRRPVAVKMILDSHLASPVVRRRFAIEAEAAAKLDHPNIVSIYEVGEYLDQPFLSMKLVQGESLNNKIARGELGVAAPKADPGKAAVRSREIVVARLMIAVAEAVHHAHLHGVLHRDLKPGNILVDHAGQPHLTDFGLAKLLDENDGVGGVPVHLTRSSALLGTPSYMSPEQAANQRLTSASDVYGLGAILYELLAGHPPFKATTLLETLRLVAEQEPKRPRAVYAAVDPDLDTICMKCLEKAPEARYTSALALAEDLQRWLRQEPIHARSAGAMLRLRRWVKRNPLGASFIVSLGVCLAVTLGLLRLAAKKAEDDAIGRAWVIDRLTHEIDSLWDRLDQPMVVIPSRDLAALDNRSPRRPNPDAITLTLALTIGNNPVGQAQGYAPFLAELEQRMERALDRQVFMNLHLYKLNSWASLWGVRHDADLQKVSQLTYVRLKHSGVNVLPLARDRISEDASLFAAEPSKNKNLTNVSQAASLRALFAHTNSVISFMAKVWLAQNGLCATNFKSCSDLDIPARSLEQLTRNVPSTSREDGEIDGFSHREVIQRVLAGEHDIGVAPTRRFEIQRQRGERLTELARFPIPVDIYVARADLPTDVASALQHSLISLKDKVLLGRARRLMVNGLEAVEDSDFAEFRRWMAHEWVFFETGQWPVTNAVSETRPR